MGRFVGISEEVSLCQFCAGVCVSGVLVGAWGVLSCAIHDYVSSGLAFYILSHFVVWRVRGFFSSAHFLSFFVRIVFVFRMAAFTLASWSESWLICSLNAFTSVRSSSKVGRCAYGFCC